MLKAVGTVPHLRQLFSLCNENGTQDRTMVIPEVRCVARGLLVGYAD